MISLILNCLPFRDTYRVTVVLAINSFLQNSHVFTILILLLICACV